MPNTHTDIIIIGAGPTGLMLANQLTRFGIDHLIIDKKSGPTDQSRALVVHSRSMEIYQQLGLSDQIVADGQKNDGMNFYKNGKQVASVTLVNEDEESSPFPFLMMYEQSKNEQLLYNHLLQAGKEVLWNTELLRIEKNNEGYLLQIKEDDKLTNLSCKYIIACDGSRSLVREFAQMPFEGGTYLNVFYVADTYVDADFSNNKLSLFLSRDTITMLFPMKGRNHFRALGILPHAFYHNDEIPFEAILDEAKKEMQMPVRFYDTGWHSTYKLHHKKVQQFNDGNIFFAGDAAHVHSPAGGQGMNTGLQDVYNLAWKLALVQKNKADASLLKTYHEERNPVAKELLKTTDNLFSGMSSTGFWYSLLRLHIVPFIVPLITRSKWVRHRLFLMVSQILISYERSSLSKGSAGRIFAGQRLPYFFIQKNDDSISIYDLLKESGVLYFTILQYNREETFAFADISSGDSLFSSISIPVSEENTRAIVEAGLPSSFIMLVRPDNYIGYLSTTKNSAELSALLKNKYSLWSTDLSSSLQNV